MIPALILFVVTYVLMLIFSKYRPYIALTSGVIFVATGMLPLSDVWGAIDWNVILMIAGTMGLVAVRHLIYREKRTASAVLFLYQIAKSSLYFSLYICYNEMITEMGCD